MTGRNLRLLETETGLDPWKSKSVDIRDIIPTKQTPEVDAWRLPLLCQLLTQRQDMTTNCENTDQISNQ